MGRVIQPEPHMVPLPITAPPTKLRHQAERIAAERAAAAETNPQDLSPAAMREELHELRVRLIELELDKEERSQAQTSLISALLDTIPDLVFIKDLDGVYLACNPALAALLGRPCEAIIGKTDYDLFPADEAIQFRAADWRVLESGDPLRTQEWLTYPDGRRVLLDTLKTAYLSPDGRLLGVLGVSRDITEIKRIEQNLRDSERSYRNQFEGNTAVMLLVDPVDGALIDANHAAVDFYGYSREQLQAMRISDLNLLSAAELRNNMAGVDAVLGRQFAFQHRLADGTLRDVEVRTSRIQFGGRPALHSIINDVTARVQAEAAQRESERNFRAFFETVADMILVATSEGHIMFSNRAISHTLGYTVEEVEGMHLLELHPAELRAEAEEIAVAMFNGERDACPLPLQARDGTLVPVETRIWRGKWNNTDCIFGVSKNLSAEQEAMLRFEGIFRNNPTLMALVELPGEQFIDANNSFLRTLGYSKTEILGKTPDELELFPKTTEHAAALTALSTHGRYSNLELQVKCKDGLLLECLCSGELVVFQSRQYLIGTIIDVTRRKQAEWELAQQRERLAGIIRATNVGTWEWHVPTGATSFNERWAEMLGYTLDELAPVSIETWLKLAHPDDLPLAQAALNQHFTGQCDHYHFEHRMRHKNGDSVWVLDSGKVTTWTPDGLPLLMLGTHQDISQRKRVEEELARVSTIQRELMHLATAFVNIPIERQDEAIQQSLATMGQLIHADRAYLFAYDLAAAVTSNTHEWCAEGITPEIDNLQDIPLEAFSEWLEGHLRGEPVIILSVAALPPTGDLRHLLELQGIRSVVTLPLLQDGACLGFVGFDALREERIWRQEEIDLLRVLAELYAHFMERVAAETATRQLQARLILARNAAQAAMEAKSLFLANMSHEIRTPLNAILGYAQIMQYEDHNSANSEYLSAITRSGEHLLTLINDLLELVRSDARAIQVTPTDFDLHHMLEDVRIMFAGHPDAHGLSLEVSLAATVPQFIHTDQGKIRQVLVNLVGNAFKFTQQGWIRVSVSTIPGNQRSSFLLVVDVEDTGCGIEADELKIIFEAFEQSVSGRKSGKGTGLGLHLSRLIAQALGGDITVTSRPGEGTCFRATFQVQNSSRDLLVAGLRQVRRLAPGQPPCHILVVDDDAINSDMLSMMLEGVGFTVEVANDAHSALYRLQQDAPVSLVLMDKRMPELDGYEAIKRLRLLPSGQALAVVVVTASGFAEERELALAAGADGFVTKPVRSSELMEAIRCACGVHYEYEPVAAAPGVPARLDLPTAALADIPLPLRVQLKTALNRGDIRSLRHSLDEIARTHPVLAANLRLLAEAYDYEQLLCLLATTENHSPTTTT